jgi:uncharacterized Zn-binding protein involved in type VI secretion
MGKPAARMGDTTAHGGTVTLGNPMVMVGKMPASAMGDMHVCPMSTGPVPHVGGPITLGSTGVLIGKKPAARVSDVTVCAGPPSMPAMGCMTVLIGEAGSGSQAGSAASAAAAAAKRGSPTAIDPFPLGEPPPGTENHYLECQVNDSAGKPLGGVKYKLTDPDGQVIVGVTSQEGRVYHSGYAKAGSFKLEVQGISEAKWSKDIAKMGDGVKLSAKAEGFEDGQEAWLAVFEETGPNLYHLCRMLQAKVSGKKLEAEWKVGEKDPGMADPDAVGGGDGKADVPAPKVLGYYFMAYIEGDIGVAPTLPIQDVLEIEIKDEEGKAVKDLEYEVTLADESVKKGKTDAACKVKIENVPSGPVQLKWKKKHG